MRGSIKSPTDIITDVFEDSGLSRVQAEVVEKRLVKSLEILSSCSEEHEYVISIKDEKLVWKNIKK